MTAAGILTTLGVGAASLGLDPEAGVGRWVFAAAVGGVCTLLGNVVARWWVAPWRRDLVRLTEGIRTGRPGATDRPDLDVLARAGRALVDTHASERRRLEERASLLERWLDHSPDGVLAVRADGTIAAANPALLQQFTVRGSVLGQRPIEAIRSAEVHEAALAAVQGRSWGPVAVVTDRRDLVVRGFPSGSGGLVVVHDVTDHRMAERARSAFVSNVSHELRTPLASISGWTEVLLGLPLTEEVRAPAEAVARGCGRLRALFEDLLELSRIEARTSELPLVVLDLWPVLEEAALPSVERALDKDQEFSLEGPEDVQVRGNAEAIKVILRNLASNAVRYTLPGGRVRVLVSIEGAEVAVHVEDNGIGIAPEHHERVFERFYRVDEGRSREDGGTGLGLAIVKHLALATSSRVVLRSQLGVGSTFSLYLPSR